MGRALSKPKRAARSAAKPSHASVTPPRIARLAERLGRMIPEDELLRIPRDLSSQIDHYVYGTPKR